ncbi:dihydrolipoamide acetyltransferase family protein [Acetobacterium tundrae]|uniref:Peripheral subunit-binding (PSBD) domain-containing protein n=1 Tax=Acetobacterium tundrae TaxID=132932 RepID=A0ABR6WHE2_9FIRM|nr:dihydrolipoamide acetyltransferase family protein [Acetobacterium tundrae]MBC3795885.1 hypothetical protein [Acetobacterium tundrae]
MEKEVILPIEKSSSSEIIAEKPIEAVAANITGEPEAAEKSAKELLPNPNQAQIQDEIELKPETDPRLEKVRATPAARRVAREHHIDIQTIPGSGPNGRIQIEDVKRMVVFSPGHSGYSSPETAVIGTALEEIIGNPENVFSDPVKEEIKEDKSEKRETKIKKPVAMKPAARNNKSEMIPNPELDFVPFVEGEVEPLREEIIVKSVPLSSLEKTSFEKTVPEKNEKQLENKTILTEIRKDIAERMVRSNLETAVITLTTEIDMTEVKDLRKKISKKIESQAHFRCTYTDFLLMATARALMKQPIINSSFENDEIIPHAYVNLGFAVDTDDEMIIPVIKNAQDMSFVEMVKHRGETLKSIKNKYYTPEDLEGSTFTITNLGMYGILEFSAIINQPNGAILSVGEVVQRVRVHQGEAVIRSVMKISLNLDRRVADGMAGAKFLQDVKADMENPSLLLF